MKLFSAPMLVILLISLATGLGDYWIKLAATEPAKKFWPLVGGCLLYGATAYGWYLAMRSIKLATIGAIFAMITILQTTLIGTVCFRESLNGGEILGLALAFCAILLLYRVS